MGSSFVTSAARARLHKVLDQDDQVLGVSSLAGVVVRRGLHPGIEADVFEHEYTHQAYAAAGRDDSGPYHGHDPLFDLQTLRLRTGMLHDDTNSLRAPALFHVLRVLF